MVRPRGARDHGHEVRLQVLLKPECRNAQGLAQVERGLRALGFEVTGTGRASISARAARDTTLVALGDGAGAARETAGGLMPVPATLAAHVQSITVAPPHTAMSTSRPAHRRGRT